VGGAGARAGRFGVSLAGLPVYPVHRCVDGQRLEELTLTPEQRPRFTVFTPTFNRRETLARVRESLVRQTFQGFEWLIVDDGSTDGTQDQVAEWIESSPFPLRYVRQENQGKHVAFNRGVAMAAGELFLTLDSDDECVPEALALLDRYWSAMSRDEQARFASVVGLCIDQYGREVGDRFPTSPLDSDPPELYFRYGVGGEKWGFTRTAVLRRFPFPEDPAVRFVPESLVWDAIGAKYRTRYVNEILRIYWIRPAGSPDTGAAPSIRIAAPGLAEWNRFVIDTHLRWFRFQPGRFLRAGMNYVRFSTVVGRGLRHQATDLRSRGGKALWLACVPAGVARALLDKYRGRW
jgi:glycosyltransferase involved in cell wall biosynthesis